MKKMRMSRVTRIEDLGPHLRRFVLQGDDLNDFPLNHEGAHFKAIFPRPGQNKPKLGFYPGFKRWMRSYTVRAFNDKTKQLTVDFAVNDHQGLAANWALNAQLGDYLGVAGPGENKYPDYQSDSHLLVADLTGLPAVAAILETLPRKAVGKALIQIPTYQDKQTIAKPEGVDIQWVINDELQKNALLEQLQDLSWQQGKQSLFVATESRQMLAIKKVTQTQNRPQH